MAYLGKAGMEQPLGFVLLSGSTNGVPIGVTATSATGSQTIHTAAASAIDVVNLYAHNPTSGGIVLYVGVGTTATTSAVAYTVPSNDGMYLDLPGVPIAGGVAITAWSSATGGVNLTGTVQRSW